MRAPAAPLLSLMRWPRRTTPSAAWLFGVLALLVVLTQQGGQSHALTHALSAARSLPSIAAVAAPAGAAAGSTADALSDTPSGALAGASDDRDAVDAVCVLCVGFANTLATAVLPGPGALPLAVAGGLGPVLFGAWRQLVLRRDPPIRGPPASFSIPR